MISNSQTQRKGGKHGHQERKKDFISFILAAEEDQRLAGEFMRKRTAEDLYQFFQEKGTRTYLKNDCEDIITARNEIGRGIFPTTAEDPALMREKVTNMKRKGN